MAVEQGRVFVSYSHADAERVRPVCRALKALSYNLWLDQDELIPGDGVIETIDDALEDSTAFIAFVGPHYFADGKFTRDEFYAACAIARLNPSWRLLVVRLDLDARIPPMSLDGLRLDYTSVTDAVGRIAEVLDRLAEIDGVSYSAKGKGVESGWSAVEVDELNDRDLRLLGRGFIEQRVDKLREGGTEIRFQLDLDLTRKIRFAALSGIVGDEGTRIELQHQLKQIEVSERFIEKARARLMRGFLGEFEVGVEMLLEEHQEKHGQAHRSLGRHLKGVVERLELRTEQGTEGSGDVPHA